MYYNCKHCIILTARRAALGDEVLCDLAQVSVAYRSTLPSSLEVCHGKPQNCRLYTFSLSPAFPQRRRFNPFGLKDSVWAVQSTADPRACCVHI
ncbi:unnamed protein product [Trichogramma brassicae]|uniref:Uncharacterized protein n=1 Tax=Trichogramma brassicae TaxID=86971 RepID=A0A6H5I039_9HYME|nr:unnamed protein product [Trichogramma brassicae]